MPFLVQKLPGAAKVCFFLHEGERVTPTADGVALDSRPPEPVFNDPWLKVTEIDSVAAKKALAAAADAAEASSAAAVERTRADDDAKAHRADLAAAGVQARNTADLDRALSQLREERKGIQKALAANPGRKASASLRLEKLDEREKKLLEAGAKSAKKAKEPKPAVAESKPEKQAGAKSAKKAKAKAGAES